MTTIPRTMSSAIQRWVRRWRIARWWNSHAHACFAQAEDAAAAISDRSRRWRDAQLLLDQVSEDAEQLRGDYHGREDEQISQHGRFSRLPLQPPPECRPPDRHLQVLQSALHRMEELIEHEWICTEHAESVGEVRHKVVKWVDKAERAAHHAAHHGRVRKSHIWIHSHPHPHA